MRIPVVLTACVALAACGADSSLRPASATFASSRTSQSTYSCAGADLVLGSLITLVQRATHVPAPSAEAALLSPLRDAHLALVATPCDKQGALAAMKRFKVAVDANARVLSAAQVLTFHAIANRIISTVMLAS